MVAVSAAALVALVWLFAVRLFYPYDLEWMEGAMLVHALRVRDGQALYAPPSLTFASFAYMPLQPAVVAALSTVFGLGYVLGRALSMAGLAVALVCAWVFLRQEGASRAVALAAGGVVAAAFAPTGAWYDLVRVDSLWLGLVAAGLLAAWRGRRSTGAVLAAAALLVAAFFTKQTAAPFIAVAAIGLGFASLRRAVAFSVGAALMGGAVATLMHVWSRGWFWTYAFGLHQRHAFDAWPAFVLTPLRLALLLGPGLALVRVRRGEGAMAAALGAALAGVVASVLGAGTQWAYANALIPGVFFLAVAIALGAARLGERRPVAVPLSLALTVLAAAGGLVWMADRAWPSAGLALPVGYDPRAFLPDATDRRAGDALVARLRAAPGSVFIPYHTFYAHLAGRPTTLHAMNLADVNRAGLGTPRDLVEAIRGRAFALIVLDVEGEGPAAEAEAMSQLPRLAGHYEIAERVDGPRVFSGAPVRPRLLLTPHERGATGEESR